MEEGVGTGTGINLPVISYGPTQPQEPTGGGCNCTQVHVPSPSPRLMGPYGAQSGLYITQASIRTPARAPKPLV